VPHTKVPSGHSRTFPPSSTWTDVLALEWPVPSIGSLKPAPCAAAILIGSAASAAGIPRSATSNDGSVRLIRFVNVHSKKEQADAFGFPPILRRGPACQVQLCRVHTSWPFHPAFTPTR
jgi:hypothetical protein